MTTRRSFLAASTAAAAGAFISKGASAADVATTQLPAKWDAETDVLVAGSGIAGMSAAISALDKGAKVLVMEKGKNYGGCAIINGGIIALGGGTRTQKEHGVEDSPEKLYKKLTNPAHHEYRKNTPELVKKYSEWCPGTQVWLEEHGVKFLPTFTVRLSASRVLPSHLVERLRRRRTQTAADRRIHDRTRHHDALLRILHR